MLVQLARTDQQKCQYVGSVNLDKSQILSKTNVVSFFDDVHDHRSVYLFIAKSFIKCISELDMLSCQINNPIVKLWLLNYVIC